MPPQQTEQIDGLRVQVCSVLSSLDPDRPIMGIDIFQLSPRSETAFCNEAAAFCGISRTQSGCRGFTLNKNIQGGGGQGLEYLLYEAWSSVRQLREQWNSRHLRDFLEAANPLLTSAPNVRFYFTGEGTPDASSATGGTWISAASLSWTMSLFGAQQVAKLISSSGQRDPFQNVKAAAEAELGEPFRSASRGVDGLLDTAARRFGGEIFDPAAWMRVFGKIMQPGKTAPGARIIQAQPPPRSAAKSAPPPTQPPTVTSPPPSQWGPMPGTAAPSIARPATPAAAASPVATEPDISPDYPFAPHYLEVYGARMHYVDEGAGAETILFLHGNPSWCYGWRNIIPHLTALGRCVAPDLIGYGRSAKPAIEYLWFDHVRYLEAFIDKMRLRNIVLVLHDQGSALGFHYAMRHQSNVKAIAFFEALVRPFTWENFSTPAFRELFQQFRTGGKGGLGWKMLVDQNMFIEQLLPQATGRTLSPKEMTYYRDPFQDPDSRLPIWQFPRQTAIGGEPKDVWDAVSEYTAELKTSKLPKLMLYATPGALLTEEHVKWCQASFPNLKSVFIGPGLHFLDESSPHRIGQEIAAWLRDTVAQGAGVTHE